MSFLGDYTEDASVVIPFTTHDMEGGAIAPSSAFEAADIKIYKGVLAKATANGLTMTSPLDSVVGLHHLSIDTGNDTGDAGFWVTGADYIVVLSPDETVDGKTVVRVIGHFSIQNRYMRGTNLALLASSYTAPPSAAANAAATAAQVTTDHGSGSYVDTGSGGDATIASVNAARDAVIAQGSTGPWTRNAEPDNAGIAAIPTAAANAAALLNLADGVETGKTVRDTLQDIRATTAGKSSGHATNTPKYRDAADTLDRVSATTTADGRTSVTTNND